MANLAELTPRSCSDVQKTWNSVSALEGLKTVCLTSKTGIFTPKLDFVGGCEVLEVPLVEQTPPDRKVV